MRISVKWRFDLSSGEIFLVFFIIQDCAKSIDGKIIKCFYVMQEFSTSWDIKATPTFFFLRDGQQIDKLVGANKPELQKKITAIIDSTSQYPKWPICLLLCSERGCRMFWMHYIVSILDALLFVCLFTCSFPPLACK